VKTNTATAKSSGTKKKPALQDVSKLTPIQKAQLARAANKASGKTGTATAKRNPLPQFKAPADFKPHFLEVTVRTEADGLLATSIRAIRFQGRYDPEAEDKKKSDMSAYDMTTMIGIQARLAGLTFKPTNDRKYPVEIKNRSAVKGSMRLPASTTFKLLLRINRRKADETLSVAIKTVWQGVKNKAGRVQGAELEKTDPICRMFRRAARFLPAAFKNVQAPPARRRKKAEDADE
jgi:hypothetical protein